MDTAANGVDGLFNAENADYDAVVLDVMLPQLDGWEYRAPAQKKDSGADAHRPRPIPRPRQRPRHRR